MFEPGYDSIPSNLADLQPGPELGGVLACIDVDLVAPHDRVTVLEAHDRQVAYHEAERYRAMTAVMDGMGITDPRYAAEAADAEIGTALHWTRRATERELSIAIELQQRLPDVWLALVEGHIDSRRAKVLCDATRHLPVATARTIIGRIVDQAARLTTGQLRARVDRLVLEADPQSAADRYDDTLAARRVVTQANPEGTANLLGLDLPPQRVTAVTRHLTATAKRLKAGGDPRTIDQLRADILCDILQGTEAPGGVVHLNVDLDTLTALASHPGELNGYGPVVADIARQTTEQLEDAEWRYHVTDTASGRTICNGTTKRRPTTAMRRRIQERNPTCVFPGCRMPSVDCDIDHTQRWTDGGVTCDCNGAPLCRRHHRTKDSYHWRYRPISHDDYQWTSRLGHTYTTSGYPP